MEFFLPGLFLMVLALIIVIVVLPSFTPFMLATTALLALIAGVYNHYSLFAGEYRLMAWTTGTAAFAPTILVASIVVFAIGYILLLFTKRGAKGLNLPKPSLAIPPPQTSTNVLTQAVGNGLAAAGLATIEKGVSANTPQKSLVSVSPNFRPQITDSQIQSIVGSRLARQL